jgi:ABC-type bacteriocin/lantibiotic exporter with double-glycine peptidase domain
VAIVLDGLMVIGYLIVLLVRAPQLGWVVALLCVAHIVVVVVTSGYVQEVTQRDLSAQADSESYLLESLSGISTLKAAGAEATTLARWSTLFGRHLESSIRRTHAAAQIDMLMATLRALGPALLLWVGGAGVLAGDLSLGQMIALSAIGTSALNSLSLLVSSGQQLQYVNAHLIRILDVLETAPEQDRAVVRPAPRLRGRVELRNVSFRYHRDGSLVLRDINLAIQPGQTVALVGRTGSGKSTLAALLLGMYEPSRGHVLYDGVPITRLDYRMLRSQCGIVLQDSFLFSGTIRDNIALHDPLVPLDKVVWAASMACIHDDIQKFPMGYDTRVSEGGRALSGGQRQRIALARALVREPAVVLLDEATSHLDVLTEAAIHNRLDDLGRTRIVIAHRLSTVQRADLILVMEDGRIAERGTHSQLVALRGRYAELVQGSHTGMPLSEQFVGDGALELASA